MDVIATIDRTIDGIARKAGDSFELPDDTDLIDKGVVRAANAVARRAPVPSEPPVGWVGRQRAAATDDPAETIIAPQRVSERPKRTPRA